MTSSRRSRRRPRWLLAAALVALGGTVYVACVPPPGPRSIRHFDAARTADLEVAMWQAYYEKRNVDLFRLLVTLTHEQYRYSWATSVRASFHLARAAATFARIREDYDQVLPDLETAYTIARDWTGATFDPAVVARAELAWWVARRVPAEAAPENVGRLIAEMNALVYDVPVDRVLEASVLRARAGRLRDDGGDKADWAEVSRLLHESFARLRAGVER